MSTLDDLLVASGKVREIYDMGDETLLLVASDRISAFDVILPTPIPDKGRVLTGMTRFWLDRTQHIVANHMLGTAPTSCPNWPARPSSPAARCTSRSSRCCRSSASCAATWSAPAGRTTSAPAPSAAHAAEGSRAGRAPAAAAVHAVHQGRAGRPRREHHRRRRASRSWAGRGSASWSAPRSRCTRSQPSTRRRAGIILADTKFEFGVDAAGTLTLADEVLTPDSSRFWPADSYRPARARRASTSSTCATTSRRSTGTRPRPAPSCPTTSATARAAVPRRLRAHHRRRLRRLPEEMGVPREGDGARAAPRRDPRSAGQAIDRSLQGLGYASRGVRAGKVFDLELDAADRGAAAGSPRELAERVLTNPLIEQFEVVVHG